MEKTDFVSTLFLYLVSEYKNSHLNCSFIAALIANAVPYHICIFVAKPLINLLYMYVADIESVAKLDAC
jgi:hypothetical protein